MEDVRELPRGIEWLILYQLPRPYPLDQFPRDCPGARSWSHLLLRIKKHVENHFTRKLRLQDLAKQAGWSVPHLCSEFKRHFGLPLIQYILQLRMNQAAYLLHDHNQSVSEVAVKMGYPDLYTFSKMFKRNFGVSPREFRTRGKTKLESRA